MVQGTGTVSKRLDSSTKGGKNEDELKGGVRNEDELKGGVRNEEEDEGKGGDDEEEDEEDEDYDPTKKEETGQVGDGEEPGESSDEYDSRNDSGREDIPDFSKIESNVSQVRTRSQRYRDKELKKAKFIGKFETDSRGLVKDTCALDMEAVFNDLKQCKKIPEMEPILAEPKSSKIEQDLEHEQGQESASKIKIQVNYTFAGKLITESKLVDRDSEEAKAYLNSTSSITSSSDDVPYRRSQVKVIREDPFTKEKKELCIKLKRPSLIDKFLQMSSNKKMKLSTLEKSRLDWASFVDQRRIGDDLKRHNKGGYLDKQDFLGRIDMKRDVIYQQAKEAERRRLYQLENK
ncbi:SWC5 [Candida oxycetoniae]|uniref:SWR1-complex protein 5 n=1 Tax=Candida oxycetoniae TaxID=497107 RepID=A0AAI9WYE9_9ASCO|nr:SWC5 [Candida oxycetoniae]KAI3404969.2 SWC5 [Candida oxycetoniae]